MNQKVLRMAAKVSQSKTLLTGLQLEYNLRLEAEKALSKELRNLFTKAQQELLQKFLKIDIASDILKFQVQEILKPFFDMEPIYNDTILYYNQQALQNGRISTINLINLQIDKKVTLFDFDQKVYDALERQTFIASQKTMDRIRGNVEANIAKSYQEGLGIKDAARNLKKEFMKMNTYELNRVARTEINDAQNAGAYQSYFDYDIKYHQWWTGQDARVRDSHRHIHGEIVEVGQPFTNGLLRPGDRRGPIREWINCRCTTVPYLMPLGFMVSPGMTVFHESDIIRIPNFEIPRVIMNSF